MDYTLIANSGIQLKTLRISLDTQEKFKLWFHEWYDTDDGQWKLDLVHEINSDTCTAYYNKKELFNGGYLGMADAEINPNDLKEDGINPLMIDDEMCPGVRGDIYKMTFTDKENKLPFFENQWLPLPYFFKRTEKKFRFGSLNWARFKLIPQNDDKGVKTYDVLIAFDTRTRFDNNEYNECPFFQDQFKTDMDFDVCENEFMLMDFCSSGNNWSYIDDRLMKLVYPDITRVSQIKGNNIRKMSYIASYIFLIDYIARHGLFPRVKLYKDTDVEQKDVDMVIDIGNSKTTALLIEDNSNFNQVNELRLQDYTIMVQDGKNGPELRGYADPFDMRLAFRKVGFGNFGIKDSRQFLYPSFVRLGKEANYLIHQASNTDDGREALSTYSSPKRYLWDGNPNREEWEFLVLKGEPDDHTLEIKGLTNQLKSDGTLDPNGAGGISHHYSRRTLMTFSFLEMLVQARTFINSEDYRRARGQIAQPRKVKRIIVTCPTAMSEVEREALLQCAADAVKLLDNFEFDDLSRNPDAGKKVEVIPAVKKRGDDTPQWYYDEATCAQLVYMYGEVGQKYKGCCEEFFNLYGKKLPGDEQPTLTVGSLDIGGGTTDLMVNKYTYEQGDVTKITPQPLFYDSFYYAGDDMLRALIKNILFLDEETSAFRKKMKNLNYSVYKQKMKNFFGADYNGQTQEQRLLRRDFNLQYSVPLMGYFLELVKDGEKDRVVTFEDVFSDCPPSAAVLDGFRKFFGFDLQQVEWDFNRDKLCQVIFSEFEPLLKKISTIMYAYACDIILLSGRPASLSPIRDIFLKYYPVSPNRLIVLNNYYVGDWYPFSENTGYITNPKTIVAMGAVIGLYASELSNLNKFVIDLRKLGEGLKSTVNYIESAVDGVKSGYVLDPDNNRGKVVVSAIPAYLAVKQIGMDSYPARTLYIIDFNRFKMMDAFRRKAVLQNEMLTDAKVQLMVKEAVDTLKRKMPFTIELERDADDKENVRISGIADKGGEPVQDNKVEIHIQSLGNNERYWLDSGAFDF